MIAPVLKPRRLLLEAALAAVLLAGCRTTAATPIVRTEIDLLGTICSITVYDRNDAAAVDAAFARLKDIDHRMSSDRDDSEVSAVNNAAGGEPVKVSPDTFAVIKEGLAISRIGSGAFDITVGPLVKLWGIGTDHARVPSEVEIEAARGLVDWRDVRIDEAHLTVRLARPGMAIDLGAIGKGFAADEVASILSTRGVKAALIDLGGNVYTLGRKPDGSPWRIGLQDPEPGVPRGRYVGILQYDGTRTVVTSGVYERFFEQGGVRYHHILDIATGFPVRNGLDAVTIVTDNSTLADAYSTLVFILGLERGRQLVEQSGGRIQAIFFTDKRELYASPGLKRELRVTDSRYALK